MTYDLIIVGSGPAGLSAAVYAKRAELQSIVIEKNPFSGGQIMMASEIDNFLGESHITGADLSASFRSHAENAGVQFVKDEIQTIGRQDGSFALQGKQNQYLSKTVIVATGASHKKLGMKGEAKFMSRGVSYCATCDGAFFKNKSVAIVGGGDIAAGDALYLSRICSKVYLIHRRDSLRASKSLQSKLFHAGNVEIVWDSVGVEVTGEALVNGLIVENVKNKEMKKIDVDGVFIAIGTVPHTPSFDFEVKTDENGYIIAAEDTLTSMPGILAVGDVRTKPLRQISTAVADGANAVYSAEQYLVMND